MTYRLAHKGKNIGRIKFTMYVFQVVGNILEVCKNRFVMSFVVHLKTVDTF